MVLNLFKKEYIKYLILCHFSFIIAIFILPVSIPIILALLTAIIIEPIVKFTQKTFKWKRKPAVITNFVLFISVISGLFIFDNNKTL